MRILNFGSLNIDKVFRVEQIVQPGQTIPTRSLQTFAGGKGANQSVALARAGAKVSHAGGVGPDGVWLVEKLAGAGVDTQFVHVGEDPSGTAIIQVDDAGQNAIFLFAGSNRQISKERIDRTLAQFAPGDVLLLQNEINDVGYLIEQGHAKGLKVCLNTAPFDVQVPNYPLDKLDTLIANETEAMGLVGPCPEAELADRLAARFPHAQVILTLGTRGVIYRSASHRIEVPAYRVKAVDTTGAGDTFIGFYLAGRAAGKTVAESLQQGAKAAAICVTRPGAIDSIPTLAEVEAFQHA
ncbi:MAG: ribokinase [Phycisphaeraceae bacterium]|nr:ribokinase [Phycisphaeraceae bacterium]